jgi:hypothetical protein
MPRPLETCTTGEFFSQALRRCFDDLDLAGARACEYLADLLTRFTAQSALHPAGVDGARLVSLGDRLGEIQRAWTPDGPHFDPSREVALRRDIGDYALFMHGFFWEHVRDLSARRHYLRVGRRAYRFVAAYHRACGRAEAALYAELAARFDTYGAVISYLRDVHLGADFAPPPRTLPATGFIVP